MMGISTVLSYRRVYIGLMVIFWVVFEGTFKGV